MDGSDEDPLSRSNTQLRHDLLAIVRAAIDEADATRLLERALADSAEWLPAGVAVHLIAAGKAAAPMAATFARIAGPALGAGLVVGLNRSVDLPKTLEWLAAGHPVPNPLSIDAGRRALAIAKRVRPDQRLVVLLSGGASALLAAPAAGISLEDKVQTIGLLLGAGADIRALNTVRKHLSAVKGGWLAAAATGPTMALVLSDVVGDDPTTIASGPTVADPTTFRDALDVLAQYGGSCAFPRAVVAALEQGARGERPETPKPGDPRLAGSVTRVIGSRYDAVEGARRAAEARGYVVAVWPEPVIGEARVAALGYLSRVASLLPRLARPACILSGGETTVTVTGKGRGGRNQEFALGAARLVTALGNAACVASVGTDGVDGPTDAAGAYVDTTTLVRARARGLGEPERYLDHNDAYTFFAALGDLIVTGPTTTNVGDVQVVLVA